MKNFLTTLILLGALQGFIVSGLLLWKRDRRLQDRLLATLLLLMSLASLNLYLMHTGWFESTDTLRLIGSVAPMVIIMPMGPLIWFYIHANLDPNFVLTKKDRWHWYPTIIDLGSQLAAIIFIIGVLTGTIRNNPGPWGQFIDQYDTYADIPRWVSLTIYTWRSLRYIKMVKEQTAPAALKKLPLHWLQQFITLFLVFQGIWLLYLIPYSIPAYSNWLLDNFDWYPVYIPLAILIYWLGIKGYLFSMQQLQQAGRKKTSNQEIPDLLIEQTKMQLRSMMEDEKLYLNQSFNLDLAASHSSLPAKTISAVLNQHLHMNFNDWVNGYRVEAFKEKIRAADLSRLTISAIAAECGFSSQATFQRIFKQSTGLTPTAYLKTLETQP